MNIPGQFKRYDRIVVYTWSGCGRNVVAGECCTGNGHPTTATTQQNIANTTSRIVKRWRNCPWELGVARGTALRAVTVEMVGVSVNWEFANNVKERECIKN